MIGTHPKQIFEVCPDFENYPDTWFLDDPRSPDGLVVDSREFTQALPYQGPRPVEVPIFQPGREVAFHLGAFDMPVISQAVVDIVERLAPGDAEFFPVTILGAQDAYSILNVTRALDCLDEQRSEITRWEAKDNRPDRLGSIHVVSTIRCDPARTGDHHIFRLRDWTLVILVSDKLKEALEQVPDLGIKFEVAS